MGTQNQAGMTEHSQGILQLLCRHRSSECPVFSDVEDKYPVSYKQGDCVFRGPRLDKQYRVSNVEC